MSTFKYTSLVFFVSVFFQMGCSKSPSIFAELNPDQDGVVSVAIDDDGEEIPLSLEVNRSGSLSSAEIDLIDKWHEGEQDQLSFVVIDADRSVVLRDYQAEKSQRLASVSKLTTALAALENVRNVEVLKVANMLKTSNNGEASRYVRLGAKALAGFDTPTKHYSQAHSCPSEFLNDEPAADIVFEWLTSTLDHVDWTGADFNDGAGCHYDNFMNSFQVTKILQYADAAGDSFSGREFEDLLSINGKDGTWKSKNLDHKGYIFAKTGTLNPNSNLSGYFYARRNGKMEKFYFSVFVNKKGGGQYSTRARKLIEGLMRYWINYYSQHEGTALADF